MPPPRPYWKGYIKLALVSCPIALYTASSSSERVAFRQINKKTGNRLRQKLFDEVTGDMVEGSDKGRGYEYAKNSYLMVEDEELDAIAIESNHTIEIDSFVPRSEIDERYLDNPYYIAPNEPVGQEAFAVIREAMRGKGMVALGRVVLSKRERVIMLQPWDKGIMGTTVRYPYEVRDSKDYFYDIADVKVQPDLLQLAEHILKSKRGEVRAVAIRRSLRTGRVRGSEKETGGHAGGAPSACGAAAQRRQPVRRAARQHRAGEGRGAQSGGQARQEGRQAQSGSARVAAADQRVRQGQGSTQGRRQEAGGIAWPPQSGIGAA
jgi:Ku protein